MKLYYFGFLVSVYSAPVVDSNGKISGVGKTVFMSGNNLGPEALNIFADTAKGNTIFNTGATDSSILNDTRGNSIINMPTKRPLVSPPNSSRQTASISQSRPAPQVAPNQTSPRPATQTTPTNSSVKSTPSK
jgi:hypothetical protein